MKKVIASLIAGLFATAAFAQAPATATAAPETKPAVEKTEAKPVTKKKVHHTAKKQAKESKTAEAVAAAPAVK